MLNDAYTAETPHAFYCMTGQDPLLDVREYEDTPDYHTHDFHQVLMALGNGTEVLIRDVLYRLDAGAALIVPAGERHDFRGGHGNRQLVLDVPPDALALPAALFRQPRFLQLHPALQQQMRQWAVVPSVSSRVRDWYRVVQLSDVLAQQVLSTSPAVPVRLPVDRVDAQLRAHVRLTGGDGLLGADVLARQYGMSERRFYQQFRQVFGVSPYAYQLQLRLENAVLWLADASLSVSDVAAGLGFTDQAAFSNQFRQRFGMSPQRWRQSQG
ncbi:helix-turn-helix domain-containing protein [Leeia oryzae]|uniref:helix-turn-helix domain-containing protein n=1 Tax=Leeia oryzae TaxID=356662 RepID=UPI00036D581F|nr:AraC family transcriptional regulator [Leeia oryzae]